MHLIAPTSNPPPLAVLAAAVNSKAGGRNRQVGALNARNAAIAAARAAGHPVARLAAETGLAPNTIARIVGMSTHDARVTKAAKSAHPAKISRIPLLGATTLFDQASSMALAVKDVSADACHWPVGEGEDARFCGARATVGYRAGALTYCRCHARQAFSRIGAAALVEEEA